MQEMRWKDGVCRWVRPDRPLFDPAACRVARLDTRSAQRFILDHHYSGSYPARQFDYGLWQTGRLVGVAVLSIPVNKHTLTNLFPTLTPYRQSLELGRFVLEDSVGYNGETWFLARIFALAKEAGLRGIVSFSDPTPRPREDGSLAHIGHVGTIYQATNARYTGRGRARSLLLLPDGTVFSERNLDKIRHQTQGHEYAERLLMQWGARPMGREEPTRWLAEALASARVRTLAHPGNHRYVFTLEKGVRVSAPSLPYPKQGAGSSGQWAA